MRLGLIADIHGNLTALDAVLARLERDRVDQIVCLGDVAALGPQPREVIARLREFGCPCVLGNTDAWLLPDPPLFAEPATTVPVAEVTRWCGEQLSPAEVAFLRTMPTSIAIGLGEGRTLLVFHASPRSLDDVIAATTPTEELRAMLGDRKANVFAGGHTHIQMLRRLDQIYVINPGSVGLPGVGPGGPDLPVNQGVEWAEYAVIDAGDGEVAVSFHRVSVDVERMMAVAAQRGMPHLDWWAGRWASDERPPSPPPFTQARYRRRTRQSSHPDSTSLASERQVSVPASPKTSV